MGRLLTEHEAVYAAIMARDEEGAVEELRKHLRRILGVLSQIFNAHQEYFE
jgi:DNA-binding GntR family transcriptional regulator